MDPFSAIAGGAGLLDVCVRAGIYLANLKTSSTSVDQDLARLHNEVKTIESSYLSLKIIWESHHKSDAREVELNTEHFPGLWEAVRKNSDAAEVLVQELVTLFRKIAGNDGLEAETGSINEKSDSDKGRKTLKIDALKNLKKVLKLQWNEAGLLNLRQRLGNCQAQLQILITALNL